MVVDVVQLNLRPDDFNSPEWSWSAFEKWFQKLLFNLFVILIISSVTLF